MYGIVYIMVKYSLVSVMYGHYRRHFHLPIDVSPNILWRSVWPELPLLVPHRNLYTEEIRKYEYEMKIIHCYHIRSSGWLLVFFPNTCFPAHVWLGVIHMTGFADLLESIVSGHLPLGLVQVTYYKYRIRSSARLTICTWYWSGLRTT